MQAGLVSGHVPLFHRVSTVRNKNLKKRKKRKREGRKGGTEEGRKEKKRKSHFPLSPSRVPAQCGFPAGLHGHSNGENGDMWPINSDTRFFVFPR